MEQVVALTLCHGWGYYPSVLVSLYAVLSFLLHLTDIETKVTMLAFYPTVKLENERPCQWL